MLGIAAGYSINESDIADSLPSEEEPLPAGMTIDVGGNYKVWLKASVNEELNVSATVPEGGLLSVFATDFDASYRMGASGAVGGDFRNHEKTSLETSTGNAAEGTDEYVIIRIDNSSAGSGIAGCEFWVVISTDDPALPSGQSSADGPTETTPVFIPGGTVPIPIPVPPTLWTQVATIAAVASSWLRCIPGFCRSLIAARVSSGRDQFLILRVNGPEYPNDRSGEWNKAQSRGDAEAQRLWEELPLRLSVLASLRLLSFAAD